MKYWEIVANNLSKAGWRCGCISSANHDGQQFWVVAAEREDARRFIVRDDEKLTAFLQLGRRFGTARPLKKQY
jgi:hypothetical protein